MGETILNLVTIGALLAAVYTDLRARRIPNALTLPLCLVGLALNGVLLGLDGVASSIQGWLLGLALLLPLFLLRGMGAGDVKLMAALGALKGPEFVYFTCLWAAVFGGVVALAGLTRSGKLGLALTHLYYFKFLPAADGSFITAGRIPYAPAIALGAFAVLGGVRWING